MDAELLRFDKNKTFVFLDTETQNLCLGGQRNLPWQISLLKVKGSEIVDQKNMFLKWNPALYVCPGAVITTGFDQTKIDRIGIDPETAFDFANVWLKEADYVIGHNIFGFDYYLWRSICSRLGKERYEFLHKTIDTLCMVKGLKFGYPFKKGENLFAYQYKCYDLYKKGMKNKLKDLAKEYGIPFEEDSLHDALYDLKINLGIWNHMKFLIDI